MILKVPNGKLDKYWNYIYGLFHHIWDKYKEVNIMYSSFGKLWPGEWFVFKNVSYKLCRLDFIVRSYGHHVIDPKWHHFIVKAHSRKCYVRSDTEVLRELTEIRNASEWWNGIILGKEARDEKETEFMNGKSRRKFLPNKGSSTCASCFKLFYGVTIKSYFQGHHSSSNQNNFISRPTKYQAEHFVLSTWVQMESFRKTFQRVSME